MPCWMVQTQSVEFQTKYKEVLFDALKSLGYEYRKETVSGYNELYLVNRYKNGKRSIFEIDLEKGKIIFPKYDFNDFDAVNELKRAYAEMGVKKILKKKRWLVKDNKKKKDEKAFTSFTAKKV